MSQWLEDEKKHFEARGISYPEHSPEEIDEMVEGFKHGKTVRKIWKLYGQDIKKFMKRKDKTPSTNFILWCEHMRKIQRYQRRQFKESFSGVKIETKKDFQIDWMAYLDKGFG